MVVWLFLAKIATKKVHRSHKNDFANQWMDLQLKIFWLERYLSYCHSEKAKTLCTPKKAKLLIALVGLFSLIYNIPAYCEHKYENNNGTISTNQTYLAKHEFYKLVYRAWIGFIVRFVIPTICLVVFNIKIIRKVSYR